jgi:hypothetical protein
MVALSLTQKVRLWSPVPVLSLQNGSKIVGNDSEMIEQEAKQV